MFCVPHTFKTASAEATNDICMHYLTLKKIQFVCFKSNTTALQKNGEAEEEERGVNSPGLRLSSAWLLFSQFL